jgi:hypothetical protein
MCQPAGIRLISSDIISNVGRRRIVTSAEDPVEIRHVIEPQIEGDGANRAVRMERVTQNTMCSDQALAEHEFRTGDAFLLEQFVQIAHRYAIAARDHRGAEITLM